MNKIVMTFFSLFFLVSCAAAEKPSSEARLKSAQLPYFYESQSKNPSLLHALHAATMMDLGTKIFELEAKKSDIELIENQDKFSRATDLGILSAVGDLCDHDSKSKVFEPYISAMKNRDNYNKAQIAIVSGLYEQARISMQSKISKNVQGECNQKQRDVMFSYFNMVENYYSEHNNP